MNKNERNSGQAKNAGEYPCIFISYRRADSLAAARGIYRYLQTCFGRDAVFMDIPEIRAGTDWEQAIEDALGRSSVIVPLIGAQWLRLTNDVGKRRIDLPKDWVRKELLHGLKRGVPILPLMIGNTPPLTAKALSGKLLPLARIQCLALRDTTWELDLENFACQLSQFGLVRSKVGVHFPKPTIKISQLSATQIREALLTLPQWSMSTSQVPDKPYLTRNELFRKFEFTSFRSAIKFMDEASTVIAQENHHPRWENIWRTVSVWLATWDVEFQVSELDVKLAHHLDDIYSKCKSPDADP